MSVLSEILVILSIFKSSYK